MNYSQKFFISLTFFFLILKVDKFQHKCKLNKKNIKNWTEPVKTSLSSSDRRIPVVGRLPH
jgi:hypothetical protein